MKQFALLADISPTTAHSLARQGLLKVVRVGKRDRVYSDEVKRFLEHGNYPKSTKS